jgi:hypothetical protein
LPTKAAAAPPSSDGGASTHAKRGLNVCFCPESGGIADRAALRIRAKCGHSRMLKHIAEFFALEKDIRGRSAPSA